MPRIAVNGIRLHYEEAGQGAPLVFVHEFAGEAQSWQLQVRFFARRYRTIVFNARGYPPSDVPTTGAAYSQDHAVEDIRGLLDALGIDRAHVCGLSMGGYATLHFGLRHPERALSLVVAGCGYGSLATDRAQFKRDVAATAERFLTEPMATLADVYCQGPTRVQFRDKDPKGWQEFHDQFAAQSALGHGLTMRGVQLTQAVALRARVRAGAPRGADAHRHRGRGRAVPRARALPQAEDPHLGAGRAPEGGAHDQPRGAGGLQPGGPGLPDRGGIRALGPA